MQICNNFLGKAIYPNANKYILTLNDFVFNSLIVTIIRYNII